MEKNVWQFLYRLCTLDCVLPLLYQVHVCIIVGEKRMREVRGGLRNKVVNIVTWEEAC